MGTATSTLRVILEDDVTPGATKVEAALDKIAADAKKVDEVLGKSGAGEKFAAGLKRIGATTVEVEAAAKAWENYAKAEGLAADRGKWTAEQAAGVRRWENATVGSVRAVMAVEKTLEEERGKAASSRARAIEAERIRGEAEMRRRVETEHRAQERITEQRQHGEAHHGLKNYMLQTAALAVSAHEIIHGVESVLEHGAEYQHHLVAMQNAGRSPEEIRAMSEASHAALRGVPTATLTGNLEILNETVGAFGSVEHAMEHLGFMAKSSAILHAVAGDKLGASAGELGNQMARFFEMRGTAGNGEVFEHEASEMMKGMVFSGGNVNPRELLGFAQQAKSALQNYNLDFLSRVAPSLIGEVGGDRAGTQANAFNSVILGKARDKKQAAAWKKYELIDPKQMSADGTGWTGGAIYHTDELLRNPLEAGEKYILPLLAEHGVDINNQLELTKALGTLFRNINAAAFANELWQRQNRNRLHKDAGLIDQVETPDEMYKRLLNTDPEFAMTALKGAFGSLMTTVSSPMMPAAAKAISGMAENLNELAIVAHNHPVATVTTGLAAATGALYAAGRLSYGLLNGFGHATFGAAAGEMATAGHEQLAAGRIMLSAAEASRAAAVAHDMPGAVPIGKTAAREGAVLAEREGAVLAEGAAEAAIGTKVAGAIEHGLGKGIKVGALEVAEVAGLTLTAGTVALTAAAAVLTIGALSNALDPKKRASDKPGFGGPFAPTGFDPNDPKHAAAQAERDRKAAMGDAQAPGRREARSQRDTDVPGHIVVGRGGARSWVRDEFAPVKNAPYFSTAPLGPDGRPTVAMPRGYTLGRMPVDPSTGTIIGFGAPTPHPELYAPADVPLPPVAPNRAPAALPTAPGALPLDQRTFGRYIERTRPLAAAGMMPQATPAPGREAFGPPMPPVTPRVDTGPLDGAKAKASEVHAALDGLAGPFSPQVNDGSITAAGAAATEARGHLDGLNASVRPQVDLSGIEAAISAVERLKAAMSGLSTTATVAVRTTGAGEVAGAVQARMHRSFAPASAGNIQV